MVHLIENYKPQWFKSQHPTCLADLTDQYLPLQFQPPLLHSLPLHCHFAHNCSNGRFTKLSRGQSPRNSSLSMPSAADLPRLFQHPPGNSRFAWFLPASEVIQRVEIAESPVKRAFRRVRPPPVPVQTPLWSRAFRLGSSDVEAPSSNRACGFPAHGFPCETGVIGISFL